MGTDSSGELRLVMMETMQLEMDAVLPALSKQAILVPLLPHPVSPSAEIHSLLQEKRPVMTATMSQAMVVPVSAWLRTALSAPLSDNLV